MNLMTEDQQKRIEIAKSENDRFISEFPNARQHNELWNCIEFLLQIVSLQGKVIEKACGQRDTYIMLYDGPLRNFSATKYECDLALQNIMRGTDEQG